MTQNNEIAAKAPKLDKAYFAAGGVAPGTENLNEFIEEIIKGDAPSAPTSVAQWHAWVDEVIEQHASCPPLPAAKPVFAL